MMYRFNHLNYIGYNLLGIYNKHSTQLLVDIRNNSIHMLNRPFYIINKYISRTSATIS